MARLYYNKSKMPEVFRKDGFRFFFFSREASEPIHVHVESAEKYAKFWLEPIVLAESHGFLGKQLREIRELIQQNETLIRKKCDEHIVSHRQGQN